MVGCTNCFCSPFEVEEVEAVNIIAVVVQPS
jgi:hypothetical protein